MLYRIQKFLVSSAHVTLFVLLLHAVFGLLPVSRAVSFAVLSWIWLTITMFQERSSLAAFEDRLLRRLVFVPLALGTVLSVLALVFSFTPGLPPNHTDMLTGVCALVELLGWSLVAKAYFDTRARYVTVGSGFLQGDVWLNPPLEVIPDGALILTDGRMARRARNSVGHSELVVRDADGKLHVSSSYIETGACMHTLRAFVKMQLKRQENYLVMLPRTPLTAEQSARAFAAAEARLKANEAWRDKENDWRTKLFNWLPIKASWRQWLLKNALSTGYDPMGKYWGGSRKDRGTCMADNLLVLRQAGVPVGEYGTGAFGLVGEVNPLVPIRLMKDPAFRLLTTADRAANEAPKPVSA